MAAGSPLPEAVVARARSIRRQTAICNLSCHAELLRLGRALQARGIPAVPLKGTWLAQSLFGGLDARQVGDIDVLVSESQIEHARAVVRALGYATATGVRPGVQRHSFHGVPFVLDGPTGGFQLELHWKLTNPRFATIDYAQLWTRILTASGSERPLRPLPDEENLVFLALHLAKHDRGVLRLLADVDRLVRRTGEALDWAHVLQLADAWSVASLLYFALWRAEALLETPIPGWVLARLRPATWRGALVDLLAGPWAVLRPPSADSLRANRFRLAYCAMLPPLSRAIEAYACYVMLPDGSQQWDQLTKLSDKARGLARGLAWTGLVLGYSLAQRCRFGGSYALLR
jgi:hypothetical protein